MFIYTESNIHQFNDFQQIRKLELKLSSTKKNSFIDSLGQNSEQSAPVVRFTFKVNIDILYTQNKIEAKPCSEN